jgi:hypothetical protein
MEDSIISWTRKQNFYVFSLSFNIDYFQIFRSFLRSFNIEDNLSLDQWFSCIIVVVAYVIC